MYEPEISELSGVSSTRWSRRKVATRVTAGWLSGMFALSGVKHFVPAQAQSQSIAEISNRLESELQAVAVTQMSLHIWTNDVSDAGTDGDVYFGCCGREFYVDSGDNDFERGKDKKYVFGDGANVLDPDLHDPRRQLAIDARNLLRMPLYIRLSGGSDWNVVRVTGNIIGPTIGTVNFGARPTDSGLWLGRKPGQYLYLR
jgi:hypothetical protein